jgi:hypothetical protein
MSHESLHFENALLVDTLLTERARHEPDRWDQTTGDLLRMLTLSNDWNGLGAEAPSREIVESSIRFAQGLRQTGCLSPSRVGAGPNGTILFEWQLEDVYVEAEITKPFLAEWMILEPGLSPRNWEVTFE